MKEKPNLAEIHQTMMNGTNSAESIHLQSEEEREEEKEKDVVDANGQPNGNHTAENQAESVQSNGDT